jgi:hypothetical protein
VLANAHLVRGALERIKVPNFPLCFMDAFAVADSQRNDALAPVLVLQMRLGSVALRFIKLQCAENRRPWSAHNGRDDVGRGAAVRL